MQTLYCLRAPERPAPHVYTHVLCLHSMLRPCSQRGFGEVDEHGVVGRREAQGVGRRDVGRAHLQLGAARFEPHPGDLLRVETRGLTVAPQRVERRGEILSNTLAASAARSEAGGGPPAAAREAALRDN